MTEFLARFSARRPLLIIAVHRYDCTKLSRQEHE